MSNSNMCLLFQVISFPNDNDLFTKITTDTNDINYAFCSPPQVSDFDVSKDDQTSFTTHFLPQHRYPQQC